MKKQQLRDKAMVDVKKTKQYTFDTLPEPKAKQAVSKTEKSILIAQLEYTIEENGLELSVAFRLLPSQNHFSNLTLELFFDDNKLNSYLISIPPSQLLSNELEFPISLDMQGICSGSHTIKVEMFERWHTGEKLTSASRYVIVEYSPTRKEDRYVKVPIVRKVDGAFRIILPQEKELYEQLERNKRQEIDSKGTLVK
jgi:hypothetical protein